MEFDHRLFNFCRHCTLTRSVLHILIVKKCAGQFQATRTNRIGHPIRLGAFRLTADIRALVVSASE